MPSLGLVCKEAQPAFSKSAEIEIVNAGTGYADGSGVVRGFGRGLAGAVGLPLGGALRAISAVSAGLAASAGVSSPSFAQRPLQLYGRLTTALSLL